MIANRSEFSPWADGLWALVLATLGVVLIVYRDGIGSFTGYYVGRGRLVDTPTPGCLLVPFGLALIAGGALLMARSLGWRQ